MNTRTKTAIGAVSCIVFYSKIILSKKLNMENKTWHGFIRNSYTYLEILEMNFDEIQHTTIDRMRKTNTYRDYCPKHMQYLNYKVNERANIH